MTFIKNKTLLIVDDQTLMRAGIKSILTPDIDIVGEAENGLEAIKSVIKYQPDIVLMDISMPNINGIEAMIEIKKQFPSVKVLMLTVNSTDDKISDSLKYGADGYLLKNASGEELLLAIKVVLSGKKYISPDISNKVVNFVGKEYSESILTHKERQVVKLVAEGKKNKDIANLLCISIKTVEKHRSNSMRKLDLHNSSALTTYAIKNGIV